METDRASQITARLRSGLSPAFLRVTDESQFHAGHAGHDPAGATHFRIEVVAARFAGKSRLERHRAVYQSLGEALVRATHAIIIRAYAPDDDGARALQDEGGD